MIKRRDADEEQAKRQFPYFRAMLHKEDELALLAKKLHPHNEDIKAAEVGNFVLGQAKGMLKNVLRALGYFLLAALAFVASIFSFKWLGK
jgi:hypothetical protein